MDDMNIGKYIKARRLELNYSQLMLAEKVGKSAQVISNWERGYSTRMKMEELAKVAAALRVSVSYFFQDAPKQQAKRPPVVDKRLQKLIDVYPFLEEHDKELIDHVVEMAKIRQRAKKQAQ